jgi:hypothetical protein
MNSARLKIFDEIDQERIRQDYKWGEQNHAIKPDGSVGRYTEEWFKQTAAKAKEECDDGQWRGTLTWFEILREEFCEVFAESEAAAQRAELVQLAAVAVSMIECIDRRK